MGKRNENTKLVAKILSLAMITTMMSGYVAPPKEVKADTFNSSYSYEVNTQATEVEAATYNVVQSASNVVNSSDSLGKAIETSTEQSTEILLLRNQQLTILQRIVLQLILQKQLQNHRKLQLNNLQQ